jgi:hypothetical protein
VDGILDSLPDESFRVELYANSVCDPSGFGQGEMFLAGQTVVTDGSGFATFSIPASPPLADGIQLAATATRLEEPGDVPRDTSEFSACLGVGAVTAAARVPDGADLPGAQLMVLSWVGNRYTLSWGASCSASDIDYAVYAGTLGDFTSHNARRCSTEGLTTATVGAVGDALYFLVVPLSENREGSYGVDGDGLERPAGISTCHPQLMGPCD